MGAMGLITATPAANATSFYIDNAAITLGSGYGIDASELSINSPTLLDVQYSSTFVNQGFNLVTSGSSYTFVLGTLSFLEPNTGGGIFNNGILFDETDNLGVTVGFTFTSPMGIYQTVSAFGTAITGVVSDAAVDYMLDWNSVDLGLFQIELNEISFTGIDRKILTATITLLMSDEIQRQGETQSQGESPFQGGTQSPGEGQFQGEQPPTNADSAVPEPATLTLLTLGLFGVTALRRKPAKRLLYSSLKIN